jgi:FixJ family two-component response regulator
MICIIVSIVDDDHLVRDATVDFLNSLGYAARGFESAEEFMDSEEVKNTHCLITDQQLPGMSGTELQKYLWAQGYRMPIIFISGLTELNARECAIDAGAIAFLIKPFEEAVLVNCLQTALSAPLGIDLAPARGRYSEPVNGGDMTEPPMILPIE